MSVFGVLAEPSRRQILEVLRRGDHAVGELVDAVGLSQPAVSKHLRVLRDAGLVDARVDAQRRVYRMQPAGLRELFEWVEPYRTMWAESLDRLEHHLDEMTDPDG